jgi:TonB family protein
MNSTGRTNLAWLKKRRLKTLLYAVAFSQLALFAPCRATTYETPNWQGLVKFVHPEYPPSLWRQSVTGKGVFLLKIDTKTGDVTEVKVLQSTGYTILNELAVKAFLQCKFKPGGRPDIKVWWEFSRHGYSRALH